MMRNGSNRAYYIFVFLIYMTIFINSIVFFSSPFEFYIGYLVYLVLLPVFMIRYGFNQPILIIFLILLITGLYNIFAGYNTGALFFKIYLGLLMSYLFYNYVIIEFNYNVEQLFKWYLYGCYIVAIIGVIQFVSFQINFLPGWNYRWIFNKWGVVPGGNFGVRVNSTFGEPTYLGAFMATGFFVSAYNLISKTPYYLSKFKSILIIVVYILSYSGLAQTGILLTAIFLALSFGFIRYFIIAIPAGLLLFNVMYNNVTEFRDRYDSLIGLFQHGKFQLGKTHGSSFILYNNYVVASENFKSNFFFGTGLGSHPIAFEKYSIAKNIKVHGFNINSADANSMLLRLFSETGLFGVIIFLAIVFKCYVKRSDEIPTNHWLISNALLVLILLNLFRQGHYFLHGFPFFVLLYIYNYIDYTKLPVQSQSDALTTSGDSSAVATTNPAS